MRSRYKILNPDGIYFITSTIVDWITVFNNDEDFKILTDVINYNVLEKKLKIYCYVFMKNHFHIICSGENLSNIINSIKSYSAKKIIEKLKKENKYDILEHFYTFKKRKDGSREFQIWQEGFHPKEIINNDELKQKIEYIHRNPVTEGYCLNETNWKYSSVRYYNDSNSKEAIKITRIV